VHYYEGRGVVQDYAEALKWYRKAAEQGRSYAQFSLGLLYYLLSPKLSEARSL
ncbi:MAG: hypothetical protein EA424_02165, partial [Planctomycetaceae bacterium]